jgi:hypothetical protein
LQYKATIDIISCYGAQKGVVMDFGTFQKKLDPTTRKQAA